MSTYLPKLKNLKDTQWTRNNVCNHQGESWQVLYHQ